MNMVNKEAIQAAIAAHTAWKTRLRVAIGTGKFDVSASTVAQDNQCQFGKWLYGPELSGGERQTEHYLTVKQLHAQFHQLAAMVVRLATSGQEAAATQAIDVDSDYGKVSVDLMQALTRWRNAA
jgi:hypothetical protein